MRGTRQPGQPLPFSKICDLQGDTDQLQQYYDRVDADPAVLLNQHPIRRWEYAMTLRTIRHWQLTQLVDRTVAICDVGGAGSGFWTVLQTCTSEPVVLVDPNAPPLEAVPVTPHYRLTIEEFDAGSVKASYDIITCISVIEHVPELMPFFKAIHRLLKPGGLLCLTTDCWDTEGPDVAHFHWMRKRIYNPPSITKLLKKLREEVGFQSFGPPADWSYYGHQLYDYSIAAIALTKKEAK